MIGFNDQIKSDGQFLSLTIILVQMIIIAKSIIYPLVRSNLVKFTLILRIKHDHGSMFFYCDQNQMASFIITSSSSDLEYQIKYFNINNFLN